MVKNPPIQFKTEGQWPAPGQWSYADYERLPDDGSRYEVLFGVLYEMAPPAPLHQIVIARLLRRLGPAAEDTGLGILIPSPIEVILPAFATPVQPDLLFVRAERMTIIKEKRVEGPPDLVIEVLSPSTARFDRRTKYDAYEQAGIPEYWIVNPRLRSVEINYLEEGQYSIAGEFGKAELIVSPTLGELGFSLDSLFPPQ
jgi:Uma2 family endonuclease